MGKGVIGTGMTLDTGRGFTRLPKFGLIRYRYLLAESDQCCVACSLVILAGAAVVYDDQEGTALHPVCLQNRRRRRVDAVQRKRPA